MVYFIQMEIISEQGFFSEIFLSDTSFLLAKGFRNRYSKEMFTELYDISLEVRDYSSSRLRMILFIPYY